jgi:hypothetical protein
VIGLLVVVVIGLPLLGLLAELALLDTRRSNAVADAALRRSAEPPDPTRLDRQPSSEALGPAPTRVGLGEGGRPAVRSS